MTYIRIRDGSDISKAYDHALENRRCSCDILVPACIEYVDPKTMKANNQYDYPWHLRYYCVGCRSSGSISIEEPWVEAMFGHIPMQDLLDFVLRSKETLNIFEKTQLSDAVTLNDGYISFRLIRNYDRKSRRILKWRTERAQR